MSLFSFSLRTHDPEFPGEHGHSPPWSVALHCYNSHSCFPSFFYISINRLSYSLSNTKYYEAVLPGFCTFLSNYSCSPSNSSCCSPTSIFPSLHKSNRNNLKYYSNTIYMSPMPSISVLGNCECMHCAGLLPVMDPFHLWHDASHRCRRMMGGGNICLRATAAAIGLYKSFKTFQCQSYICIRLILSVSYRYV